VARNGPPGYRIPIARLRFAIGRQSVPRSSLFPPVSKVWAENGLSSVRIHT